MSTTPRVLADLALSGPRTTRNRLGTVVVHDLVAAIVTGTLAPNDPLPPEADLCEQFGVSRTVIRESVKRLEEKGMVEVAQGRGTRVTDPSEWNILDRVVLSTMIEHDETLGVLDELAVVRGRLEEAMAEDAAERADGDDLDRLRRAHRRLAAATGSREGFAQADVDFHVLVMQISGDRLSQAIARTLIARASENARFYGAPGPDAVALTVIEHEEVLEAIARGDAAEAGRRMRTHITKAWERRRLRD